MYVWGVPLSTQSEQRGGGGEDVSTAAHAACRWHVFCHQRGLSVKYKPIRNECRVKQGHNIIDKVASAIQTIANSRRGLAGYQKVWIALLRPMFNRERNRSHGIRKTNLTLSDLLTQLFRVGRKCKLTHAATHAYSHGANMTFNLETQAAIFTEEKSPCHGRKHSHTL